MNIELSEHPEPKVGEACIFACWQYDILHPGSGIVFEGKLIGKQKKGFQKGKYLVDHHFHRSMDCAIPKRFVKDEFGSGMSVNIDESFPIDIDKVKKLIEDNIEDLRYEQ